MEPLEREYSREQLEAAKHEMIRRHPQLSLTASAILAELISHDYVLRETGIRKGEVWVSQETMATNLKVSRRTVQRHIREVLASPFVRSHTLRRHASGSVHLHYVLNWDAIMMATVHYLNGRREARMRQIGAPESVRLTPPIGSKWRKNPTEGNSVEL